MSLCNKRKVLTIKAFSSGEAKPVATKMAIIPDPDKITLRALIDQKIRQAAPSFAFSTSTILHISRVVATDKDQTDVFDFLDFPTSILLEQLEAKHPGIAVTIGTAAPSQDNDPCKDANNTSNNADNNQPRNTSRTPSRLASGENSVLNNIEPEGVIPNHDGNCESESEGVESYGPALLSNSSNGNHSINDDDTSDDVVGSECVVGCNSDEDNGIFEEENNSFDEDEGDDNDVSSTYSGNPSSSIDSKGGIGDLSSIPSTNESNESGHASNVLEYGLCKSSNANGDETIGAISNVTPMDVLQTLVVNAFAVYRAMNPQEPMRFDPSSPIPLLPVSVCGTNIMDSISVMTPTSVTICEPEVPIKEYENYQESSAPDITTLRSIVNDCINAGNDAGAIDVITPSIIQDNGLSISFDVPLFCLTALWILARRSDDNKKKIIFEGSTLDSIIEVMLIYRELSVDIQKRACGLLWALSMKPNDRVHIAQSGGCKAILTAMAEYIDDESLQIMALGALKVLTCSSKAKNEMNTMKTLSIVSSVMQKYAYNAVIQCEGCVVISNLVMTDDGQFVVAVSEKEVSAIVNGILANQEARDVHETACFTLMRLASSSANVDLIRSSSTSRVALELAFEKSPEKVNNILILLRRLNFDVDDIDSPAIEGR